MENKTSAATEFQNGLDPYSEREIVNLAENVRIAVAKSDAQIREFVSGATTGAIRGKKLLLGRIGNKLAQRIFDATGVYLKGYNLELRADETKHAINEHGDADTEAARGQQAITADDVAVLHKIVSGFDNVLAAPDNSLHFIKDINGRITAVTVYAKKSKSLSPKTMYKKM